MKAAVTERYGPPDVLSIRDVPKPEPKENEVLVRIHATSVEIADARIRSARVPSGMEIPFRLAMGLWKPKTQILGMELSGEIEAVGSGVTRFKVGDKVVGSSGFKMGCHAEYACLAEDGGIALKPDNLSHAEAVSVLFGGTTAWIFFKIAELRAGQTILINGASGSVGTAAVVLAKHMGAEVTAVCSTKNIELVKSLGADKVIDYTKEDVDKVGARYDFVMDNVSNMPLSRAEHLLKPDGKLMMLIPRSLFQQIASHFNKRIVQSSEKHEKLIFSNKGYAEMMMLAIKGGLKPVIDSVYPFSKIAEAHARVDSGRKVGCVVVELIAED